MKYVQKIILRGIDYTASSAKIHELIRERGFNHTQIGKILNISPQAVDKWCSVDSFPSIDNLYDLCSILDCTVDTLLIGNSCINRVERCEDDGYRTENTLIRYISR